MKASQITIALQSLIKIQQPTFLWGPPGVGKSQIIHQTAQQMELEVTDIRAVLLDPVDLRGLPKISKQGLSEWCSPGFLPQEGKGILFLDELNAAPPLVQAACYQLVLDRKLGEYVLPKGWSVIAAGNRERDRAVTHRMPSALANRFVHIDFTVDNSEWVSWAAINEIAREIIEFLKFRPLLLHHFDPELHNRAFPSPRSWEFASRIVKNSENDEILPELLEGTVGKGAAKEFIAFVKFRNQLPDVEKIFSNPMQITLPKDPAVLSATCEMVGKSACIEHADQVISFADRLPEEFGVLLVREAVRNCDEIARSDIFAAWAARNANVLV